MAEKEGNTFHSVISWTPPLDSSSFENWVLQSSSVAHNNKLVLVPNGVDRYGLIFNNWVRRIMMVQICFFAHNLITFMYWNRTFKLHHGRWALTLPSTLIPMSQMTPRPSFKCFGQAMYQSLFPMEHSKILEDISSVTNLEASICKSLSNTWVIKNLRSSSRTPTTR